jgi:hypothetical protein
VLDITWSPFACPPHKAANYDWFQTISREETPPAGVRGYAPDPAPENKENARYLRLIGRKSGSAVGFLSELHALKIDLFLRQQGLDITTPAGKAMFQMMGVFAEFDPANDCRTSPCRSMSASGTHPSA